MNDDRQMKTDRFVSMVSDTVLVKFSIETRVFGRAHCTRCDYVFKETAAAGGEETVRAALTGMVKNHVCIARDNHWLQPRPSDFV